MRIKSINWNEKEVEKIKIILIILTILLILEFVKVNLDILETYINLFKKGADISIISNINKITKIFENDEIEK